MAEQAEDLAPDQERDQTPAPEPQEQEHNDQAQEQGGFDVESVARAAGWAPKEEWRGDDGQEWVDAASFVTQRLERAQNLGKEVKRLRRTMETQTRTSERILSQQREQAIQQARAEVRRAVEENDTEAAERAVARVQSIEATRPDPHVTAFADRNADWFNVDDEATAYAHAVAQVHANRGAPPREQVEEAEKAVRKRFPELFGEQPEKTQRPAAKAPTMGGGQRTPPARRGPLTLADLPKEAQDAARRFEKRGVTLEQFVKTWEEENGR